VNLELEAALARALACYPDAPAPDPAFERPEFWERASRGGVAALLATSMNRWTPDLKALARAQAAMGMRAKAVLAQVLRHCERAGIAALPIKGPLLGERLYPEPHLRPTSDIDLLVPAAERDRTVELLTAAGGKPPGSAEHAYYGEHHHHVNVALNGVLVEIHFRASANFGVFLPSEPLLARSSAAKVGGIATRVLEPHDELVYLAVHAAAHNLARDVLLLDLRRLDESVRIDPRVLRERAGSFGLERAVGVAIQASVERCGTRADLLEPAWARESVRLLRRLPRDLPMGDSDDRAEQLRGFWAHAILAPSPRIAAASAIHDAARIAKRRLHKRWPAIVPEAWSG